MYVVVESCSYYQTAYTYIFVHLKKIPYRISFTFYTTHNTLYKPMRILHIVLLITSKYKVITNFDRLINKSMLLSNFTMVDLKIIIISS